MVVNSYRKLPGKGTNLLPSPKLNPILLKTPENPCNPPAVPLTSRIELQYLLPLVVKVCQRPSFAIVGIQCHSTVISLYKMCAQDNHYWGQDYIYPYLDRQDFYAPFKGKCIGALDGTHVKLQFRRKGDGLVFRGRKGYPTTNILAVCDFNLTFVYVSCGWDGISHDHHIFKQATKDPIYKFPHPPQGKFYLVDAGYPNAIGYLAPYKGYHYHQEEFRRGLRPINDDCEYFNRAHSSLRSMIERTFRVWKKRFRILENIPIYSLPTQVQIILASMAIHNFI
jgi:hypothetical protein